MGQRGHAFGVSPGLLIISMKEKSHEPPREEKAQTEYKIRAEGHGAEGTSGKEPPWTGEVKEII